MKQQGIGTVIGTTTSDVLKKLKEAGQDTGKKTFRRQGKDTVSISVEAREMMATEQNESGEEETTEPE